ncbi:hypothetical protein K0M31_003188 [Melipona bicolor]|uniref:Sas10 C-terminal domain-containing protein n=1 Tax=Melipona bicolor TaxID=60889 RepID=A0AA40FYR3_9HYME|nr:hypothetical protein K0M31_003188 [Melipona bicolor]
MNEETMDLEDVNMNNVINSEEEYSENERELLRKVRDRQSSESYDSDYEVYGLLDANEQNKDDTENEDQTDSMESDIEGLQEDFDLPNEKAWGRKKKAYYSTDFVDPDYATISQKDLAEAEIEEEEARNIQRRLAEQLDDIDFGLDLIQPAKSNDEKVYKDVEQFVKTDLGKLSKRQKQTMMQKESPEFMILVNDLKGHMTEARDLLAPFLRLIKDGIVPNCPAVSFIKTKYHLLLNYCINISFYLMLKAKRLPVNSHPIIKRLAQYRQLLNQLESAQGNLMLEVQEILRAQREGKALHNTLDGSKISIDNQRSCLKEKVNYVKEVVDDVANVHSLESESEFESELEAENKHIDKEKVLDNKEENKMESTNVPDVIEDKGKRAITYQMAKNKGLTPYRKKEQRNPRVKHRNKYRKAKIRRKGAIREVRKEITRYAGEISGIKASVKKSIKLK